MTRRRFLKRGARGVVGILMLPSARWAFAYQVNEHLRLAVF
jgi:hypothetical protein